MPILPQHTYEELRNTAVDILIGKEIVYELPNQFMGLAQALTEVFARRQDSKANIHDYNLHQTDLELLRDVFWDLFRQGTIILGLNDLNPQWPFFRLSHFGKETLLNQSPYHFHSPASFLEIIKKEVPNISSTAQTYLNEAVAAFYVDCRLATCVMIGAAAEVEFLRLVELAASSPTYSTKFASVRNETFIRQKITKFQNILRPLVSSLEPKDDFEDWEINLSSIQSVLRIARNQAGHPTARDIPSREQVYVLLQLFVPFAIQLKRLGNALKN